MEPFPIISLSVHISRIWGRDLYHLVLNLHNTVHVDTNQLPKTPTNQVIALSQRESGRKSKAEHKKMLNQGSMRWDQKFHFITQTLSWGMWDIELGLLLIYFLLSKYRNWVMGYMNFDGAGNVEQVLTLWETLALGQKHYILISG